MIGDQLRMPVMWCEMGSCVSWHADPAALGEADTRARAIGAGSRIDALGRLACPRCQRPTPATGPPAGLCRGTGRWLPPGPPGSPPYPAAVPPAAPHCAAAVTPEALPAATPPPAGRGWNGTTRSRPTRPCPLAGTRETRPAPPRSRGLVFNAVRAWRARGGRPAAPGQGSEPGEDLMIAARAHAGPALAIH